MECCEKMKINGVTVCSMTKELNDGVPTCRGREAVSRESVLVDIPLSPACRMSSDVCLVIEYDRTFRCSILSLIS